ncbi:hypothetical protein Glove_19g168 [Diversispora epigaea]|uniref:Uncharacterized protein n=1 Tax=Diversispora epigaea TaxID=1348612 RepID=A0A397JKR7_9GLOM|nr:hypothetical protein Glove_19g168 [Diversispora epigaea]
MKLIGEKNILSLLKRPFVKKDPQIQQSESVIATSGHQSPKKNPYKIKINYSKDFGTENWKDQPRGVIKGLEKSYDNAINDLSKAIRIGPINCFALKSRVYCYYQLKLLEEALCDLNMVIILGCSDENTHINKLNII